MDLNAIYTIWLREIKRFYRAKSRIIGSLGMPFFFLALMGSGMNASFSVPGASNYLDFMAPGILGMVILFGSMISGVSVIWDRQFGFLKEILVAPISRVSIVFGKTLGGATTALIQAMLMLLVSLLLGVQMPSLRGFILVLGFMTLTSVGIVALGLAFASKMEDPHGFQLIINFVIMPMFFLSGALFPLDALPAWLKTISLLNPLTYGVDGLRGSWMGVSHFPLIFDFTVLAIFSLLTVYSAAYLFQKSEV